MNISYWKPSSKYRHYHMARNVTVLSQKREFQCDIAGCPQASSSPVTFTYTAGNTRVITQHIRVIITKVTYSESRQAVALNMVFYSAEPSISGISGTEQAAGRRYQSMAS
jgi:hypothetical protein